MIVHETRAGYHMSSPATLLPWAPKGRWKVDGGGGGVGAAWYHGPRLLTVRRPRRRRRGAGSVAVCGRGKGADHMTMRDVPSFGDLVRRYRRDAGMTADELAAAVGLPWRALNELERGEGPPPSAELAARVAAALRLGPAERAALAAAATHAQSTRSTTPTVPTTPPVPAVPAVPAVPPGSPPAAPAGATAAETAETAAPQPATPHAQNLPIPPTALLGREAAVRQVKALLGGEGARLVTLTGPGGIGKTRLAIQVAAELLDAFDDSVYFVRLSRLSDPALVLPTIAQTLGVQEQGGQAIAETLRAYLRNKRLLLVLDNFEQVAAAARAVAALLEAAPGLKALVTSQMPLHLRGCGSIRSGPCRCPTRRICPRPSSSRSTRRWRSSSRGRATPDRTSR